MLTILSLEENASFCFYPCPSIHSLPQQEIAKADQKHFMILFRDHSLQFRSLYSFTPESEELTKVYGTGPRHITNKMTDTLYK